LGGGKFLSFRVFFPAKDMDGMIQTNQRLRKIVGIEFDAGIFPRRKAMADLEYLHNFLKKDFISLRSKVEGTVFPSISKELSPNGSPATVP
jgi:hypothetical protein